MNPELDQIALRYAGKLFPDFLYIIEDNHDYNFVMLDKSIFDDKLIYEYITNDYRLRNLNKDQTEYIFNTIEKYYSKFLKKQWFEFNSLTSKFYKQDDKSNLPEKLQYLNDNNFIEHVKNQIELNKLKIIENYKKVKECIFITRPYKLFSNDDIMQSIWDSLFSTKELSNEEISDYILKWVELSVTLEEWQQNKKINLDEELELWELSEEKIQEIVQHKFNLFNELKNKIVNNCLIKPFNKIFPDDDKITVAKRDLKLIENLMEGNIDEIKSKRLEELFYIKNWKITATHFDQIIRHKYKTKENYDIHDTNSYLDAHVVLDYKKFLNKFLQSYGKTDEMIVKPVSSQLINNIVKPKKKLLQSFKYTNSDSTRLTDLMKELIQNNFIDKKTELKNFRKIFSGNEIDKKIIWIGNISELSYFIKTIHNELKKIEDTKQQIWQITSKCFIQSDGKLYDKSKFRGQKIPANKSIIDKIAKIL